IFPPRPLWCNFRKKLISEKLFHHKAHQAHEEKRADELFQNCVSFVVKTQLRSGCVGVLFRSTANYWQSFLSLRLLRFLLLNSFGCGVSRAAPPRETSCFFLSP